jgi:hypothetical protein
VILFYRKFRTASAAEERVLKDLRKDEDGELILDPYGNDAAAAVAAGSRGRASTGGEASAATSAVRASASMASGVPRVRSSAEAVALSEFAREVDQAPQTLDIDVSASDGAARRVSGGAGSFA